MKGMHALAKWMESDTVFDSLGALIIATGILVAGTLLSYLVGIIV
jgi:hypothetical protein